MSNSLSREVLESVFRSIHNRGLDYHPAITSEFQELLNLDDRLVFKGSPNDEIPVDRDIRFRLLVKKCLNQDRARLKEKMQDLERQERVLDAFTRSTNQMLTGSQEPNANRNTPVERPLITNDVLDALIEAFGTFFKEEAADFCEQVLALKQDPEDHKRGFELRSALRRFFQGCVRTEDRRLGTYNPPLSVSQLTQVEANIFMVLSNNLMTRAMPDLSSTGDLDDFGLASNLFLTILNAPLQGVDPELESLVGGMAFASFRNGDPSSFLEDEQKDLQELKSLFSTPD